MFTVLECEFIPGHNYTPSLPTHASKVYYRWTMLVPSPCPAFDSLLACGESLETKLQQLANETRVSDIQNNLANHLL